jgi:hypothetical protein
MDEKLKEVQILQFGFCLPILVEFISETIRDREKMHLMQFFAKYHLKG